MRILAAFLTLATVGATLATTTPALAQAGPPMRVAFGDLNLGSPAGRATLDRRLRTAVARVCGVAQAPGLDELVSVRTCRSAAMEQAWGQLRQTAQSGQFRGTR